VIIVNKMDDHSVQWDKGRFDEIHDRMIPFLKECGYDTANDVVFVPISGLHGENVVSRDKAPKWWSGPCLIEILNSIELRNRNGQGQIRVPILDKMYDRGPIVFGKVESGTLRNGDKLCIMPQNLPVQVVNIYNGKDEAVAYALPGENIKVKLFGIEDEEQVDRGQVLCPREPLMPASDLLECEIQILELLDYKPIMSKGY
jgi:peptide chain release factor subunit 3